ncbi:MAG: zinc ABC transporter substrate-binding protein [Parachlamydiales bacterium]|nr:zinc ABC transporter substrate-binding protein [Parachlamydiales bacterium]
MKFYSCFNLLLVCILCHSCSNHSAAGNRSPRAQNLKNWIDVEDKVRVLCTTEMINDIVQHVGQDKVSTITLITGQLDPHTYELVKGDDEKLAAAQVIFYNGLGLEHGPSLHHHLNNNSNAVAVGDDVAKRNSDQILLINGQLDPHIWLDISLWKEIIDPVVTRLSELDPDNGSFYQYNGQVLKQELAAAHQEVKNVLQNVPDNKRFLVTSHDAFNYFTRAYLAAPDEIEYDQWKKRFQAPEGLAPEGQLSTTDIQQIIKHMLFYRVVVLFPESNVSKDSIRKIVNAGREKGMDLLIASTPLYADAMGPEGSGGETYTKMVLYDAQTMAEYFAQNDATEVNE